MNDVVIVGDGPGGLSAALFLAKNGLDTLVFGQDKTAMHAAMLYNYLGIEEMTGSEFQRIARAQITRHGATLYEDRVTAAKRVEGGFQIETEGGETMQARYLILSEGRSKRLADGFGLTTLDNGAVAVDNSGFTGVEGLFVVGRSARPGRSQAMISAGDGAAVALAILARERGEDFCDWDSP